MAEEVARLFRGFADKEAHFGMARFEVDVDAALTQLFRGRRTDGGDDHSLEPREHPIGQQQFFGNLHQVNGLGRGGKQHHIQLAVGNRTRRSAQRLDILRQRPLIHRDRCHPRAARLEAGQQIGIGCAVLLDGDVQPVE